MSSVVRWMCLAIRWPWRGADEQGPKDEHVERALEERRTVGALVASVMVDTLPS